jgi:hypothetical protein
MSRRMQVWAPIVLTELSSPDPALAADDPAVLKDLTAVIACKASHVGRWSPLPDRATRLYRDLPR